MTDIEMALEALARIGKILATKIPHNPEANKDYGTVLDFINAPEPGSIMDDEITQEEHEALHQESLSEGN